MPFTYASFKAFLTTFLWKQNDVDLANSLDSLIMMADGELNRVLDIQRRQKTVAILPETQDYVLPDDFRTIVSLNNMAPSGGDMMVSTTLQDLYKARHNAGSRHVVNLYAIDEGAGGAKLLRLVGPFSPSNPGMMTLVYRSNVPNMLSLNGSWLAEDFLDLYTYTILSHAAPFLREDERLAVWQGLKAEAVLSALAEDKHQITHGGSPMQMRPHRYVP